MYISPTPLCKQKNNLTSDEKDLFIYVWKMRNLKKKKQLQNTLNNKHKYTFKTKIPL